MNINKKTDFGTIEINDVTFSKVLRDAVALTSGHVHLASKEGKILGGFDKKVSLSEASQNMLFAFNPDVENGQKALWIFYVIVDFGTSISEASDLIFNYIIENFKAMMPGIDLKITMRIVGVKAKQVAPRNLEISREFMCEKGN